MAYVINRAFNFDEEKPLVLENCEFIRRLSYLGNWTTIRIGGLFSVGGWGNVNNVSFEMGVCSGTLWPGSTIAGPRHQLGVSWTGDPTPGTFTKTLTKGGATTYPWYEVGASAPRAYRRTSLGITAATASANVYVLPVDTQSLPSTRRTFYDGASNSNTYVSSGGIPRAWPLIIEIDRTGAVGTTVTINYYGYVSGTTTGHPFSWKRGDLYRALESRGTPSLNGVALTAQSSSLAATDMFGVLDSIYVYWNRSSPLPLYIHSLGACVFTRLGTSYPGVFGGGFDSFDQYYQGTLINQGTSGYEWDSNPFKSYGTAQNSDLFSFASPGTLVYPNDSFEQYNQGTLVNQGTLGGGWGSDSIFKSYGTTMNSDLFSFASPGTLVYPNDGFEQYLYGTVLSSEFGDGTILVNSGTGWSANGIVYPGAYKT